MGFLVPETADAWRRMLLRCLIIACLLVLGLESYCSSPHEWNLRYDARGKLDMIGAFLGVLLCAYSLVGFRQTRTLSSVGVAVSIPAMLLMFISTIVSR
jgi:hypothetical protein